MLFFELFPAFVTLVSLIVAAGLFLANRRAADEPPQPNAQSVRRAPPDDTVPPTSRRSGLRPSMRA